MHSSSGMKRHHSADALGSEVQPLLGDRTAMKQQLASTSCAQHSATAAHPGADDLAAAPVHHYGCAVE